MNFEKLLQPARIGQMELRNRMIMPAMLTSYATPDGYATERLKNYHEARARGGVGGHGERARAGAGGRGRE